jgi:DNA-directed RNA polymerase
MDATCSGLQHFSALLRDPVGGLYVNLSDEAKCGPKQDIYARVASSAMQAMQADLEDSEEETRNMAKWWLSVGIPRSLAKKPVMTYVYGATLQGTCQFVENYIENETDLEWPEQGRSYLYSQYAAIKLFQGIAATVPSAEYAMHWLKEIAKAQPRGKRMEWRTPTGFLVQHDYLAYKDIQVFIRSCGMKKVLVRESTEDTRPIRMQNAIAPNFVHALDASHLTLTALKMQSQGLNMVGIHDSYGTHPSDVDTLHRSTREAFVELYNNKNILGEFLWDVGAVRETPMRGTLDVTQVLESEFFFC